MIPGAVPLLQDAAVLGFFGSDPVFGRKPGGRVLTLEKMWIHLLRAGLSKPFRGAALTRSCADVSRPSFRLASLLGTLVDRCWFLWILTCA